MASIQWSYMDDDASPVVYSSPPGTDDEGNLEPVRITVLPWGPDPQEEQRRFDRRPDGTFPPPPEFQKSRTTMYFTVDEAEEFARKLLEVVLAAKDGVYSEFGVHLQEFSREEDLKDAWKALGLEPSPDD